MRSASEILDQAYAQLREQPKPGMREREISHRFSIAQREAGAHEVGAHAVVAGPDRGLFGFPTDKLWDADDLLYGSPQRRTSATEVSTPVTAVGVSVALDATFCVRPDALTGVASNPTAAMSSSTDETLRPRFT